MTLALEKTFRKARVWLGELPPVSYAPSYVSERTLVAEPSNTVKANRAAIEVFIPRGGMFHYGLLGAHFTPDQVGKLVVQVAVESDGNEEIDWSLAGRFDKIRVGIPAGRIERSTLAGALIGDAIFKLGSGVLCFDCAASSAAGSAPMIFEMLAGGVVQLIAAGEQQLSEEQVRNLLNVDRW